MANRQLFLSPISSDKGLFRAEALRVGEWDYPGDEQRFTITRETLAEIKRNWDAQVKGPEVTLNDGHDDDRPCGWVKALELSGDGEHLYAMFEITDSAKRKQVEEGSVKYVSSELDLAWTDPETQKGPLQVFEGMALTNRPYIKRMEPIQPLNLSEYRDDFGSDPGTGEPAPIGTPDKTSEALRMADKPENGEDLKLLLEETKRQLTTTTEQSEAQKVQLADLTKRLEAQAVQTRNLEADLKLSEYKARLQSLFRRGKLTVPAMQRALRLGEVLLRSGNALLKLAEPVKVCKLEDSADNPATEEVDKVDLLKDVVDMMQELPDALVESTAQLEEDDGPKAKDDDADILKDADKLQAADPKLTRRSAIRLAAEKRRGNGGKS